MTKPRLRVWSIKTVTVVALIVAALSAGSIFFFGHRSIFAETELTLGAIAMALFLFLTIGLYHGVRVRRRDIPSLTFQPIAADRFNFDSGVPDLDCPIDAAGEGCLYLLLGILFWAIAIVVILFLTWLLVNLGIWLGVVLAPALTWMFYRALRLVFAHSRQCKGKLWPSAGKACLYTILYTGWLFAAVELTRAHAIGLSGARM